MNYLVFLDPRAGELEKILSGVKTAILREFDLAQPTPLPVNPGDSLYFLRNHEECAIQVSVKVGRVVPLVNGLLEDLSQPLKELQPRLQLTESQYTFWSVKKQVLLVEFHGAQKIPILYVDREKIAGLMDWITFEEFSGLTLS